VYAFKETQATKQGKKVDFGDKVKRNVPRQQLKIGNTETNEEEGYKRKKQQKKTRERRRREQRPMFLTIDLDPPCSLASVGVQE